MKKSKIVFLVLLTVITLLQIFILIINNKYYNNLKELENSSIKLYESKTDELDSKLNAIFELENELQLSLAEYHNLLEENNSNIKKVDTTYSNILKEQKNKTVDITQTDNAVLKLKREANSQFRNKQYFEGYTTCKKVLAFQSDDLETRELLVKCLYYSNPFDSTKYGEILENITIISRNKKLDSVLLDIEKNIESERAVN